VNSKRPFYNAADVILGKVLSNATVDVVLHLVIFLVNFKCVPTVGPMVYTL